MSSFIEEYLKSLQESIQNKVDSEFQVLKDRVNKIDHNLTNLEYEIEN